MTKCLTAILFFAAFFTYAQQKPKITLGKPYGVIDADEKYYFARNNEILTVKIDRRTVTLQKFNAATLTFKTIKLYDDFDKDAVIEKVTQFKNKYYLFYSQWDGEHEQLYAREIDFTSGTFKGKPQRIVYTDEKISGSLAHIRGLRAGVVDKFDFFFSNDSSVMVVQYRMKPEKRSDHKNYDVIGMSVFDETLTAIWQNKVKMPYTEKTMNNLDYTVDKSGNVFIVTSVYDDETTDEKKEGKDEANYHLEILKVTAKTAAVTSTSVDVKEKFIKTVWLYESAKGYMIAAGFYNKGKRAENADGVIMFKLGQDGKLFDLKTYEIPLEILNQYASNREKRKNAKKDDDDRAEFENLSLREIIPQHDGSIILIGEQYFSITTYNYNPSTGMGGTSMTRFYRNDMLITKIDEEGKLAWMKKLPKRQMGAVPIGGMSYRYFRGKNEHYLTYLDHINNLNLPITEVPSRHVDGAGGFFTAYKINDATGEVSKISILDTRDVQGMEVYQFKPSRVVNIGPSTFVFEAYKKKKEDILVKVALE